MEQETNEQCLLMQEDYLQFVQQIGSREAITRRFFLIFEYEPWSNTKRSDEEGEAINALQSAVHTATNYLRQCGNEVIVPENWDEFTVDVLYNLLCRNESAVKPLSSGHRRLWLSTLPKGATVRSTISLPPNSVRQKALTSRMVTISALTVCIMPICWCPLMATKRSSSRLAQSYRQCR